jgi:hypothetical protein
LGIFQRLLSIRNVGTQWVRNNGSGIGGFLFVGVFGISQSQPGMRCFFGLSSIDANLSNANPTTYTNIIGVGFNPNDANFSLIHNDASGTATKVNLGANFPATTVNTDLYELRIYCNIDSNGFFWKLTNLSTNIVTEGFVSTDIPAASTLLAWQLYLNNNAQAASVALDSSFVFVEANY